MIVLDTNVISAMMKPHQAPMVLDWLDQQPVESIWTTAISVYEIRFGLQVLPEGQRRKLLEARFDNVLEKALIGRVLDFNHAAALASADLAADGRTRGVTIDIRDLQIAGIALAHRASLATRNVRHFEHTGITVINPWDNA